MRKVIKHSDSKIVVDKLMYKPGDSSNNKKIEVILLEEQKSYCAYTDEFIGRADAKDIEHFDPTLKGSPNDNYNNWFIVKHQWNKEKSDKWKDFLPVLHPTSDDLEDRIIYFEGDYIALPNDLEAQNFISLVKLNDLELASERKRYINRKKREINAFGEGAMEYFFTLLNEDKCEVHYPRAIKEEFKIDIFDLLDSNRTNCK